MCGIAGFVTGGKSPKTVQKLYKDILTLSVKRGRDATGIAATMSNGKIKVSKDPVPSPIFVRDAAYKVIMDKNPRAVIGHVRAATKGSPFVNKNNHPILAGNIVGVHNGGIHNDDYLTKHYNLTRRALVDSEVIFALLNKVDVLDKESIQRALSVLDGNYALAFQHAEQPDKIWLVRGPGRPLVIVRDKKLNTVWFVSESDFIIKAYRMNRRSIRELEIGEMEEGDVMSIDFEGTETVTIPAKKKRPLVRKCVSQAFDFDYEYEYGDNEYGYRLAEREYLAAWQ